MPAFNLSFLPLVALLTNEYELLRSSRLSQLLDDARRRYQFVILDVPPLPPVPDCRVIGDSVDGFIVVVAAHRTTRRLLDETLGMLEPEKVVGLVFNRDDEGSGESLLSNHRQFRGRRSRRGRRLDALSWMDASRLAGQRRHPRTGYQDEDRGARWV